MKRSAPEDFYTPPVKALEVTPNTPSDPNVEFHQNRMASISETMRQRMKDCMYELERELSIICTRLDAYAAERCLSGDVFLAWDIANFDVPVSYFRPSFGGWEMNEPASTYSIEEERIRKKCIENGEQLPEGYEEEEDDEDEDDPSFFLESPFDDDE